MGFLRLARTGLPGLPASQRERSSRSQQWEPCASEHAGYFSDARQSGFEAREGVFLHWTFSDPREHNRRKGDIANETSTEANKQERYIAVDLEQFQMFGCMEELLPTCSNNAGKYSTTSLNVNKDKGAA